MVTLEYPDFGMSLTPRFALHAGVNEVLNDPGNCVVFGLRDYFEFRIDALGNCYSTISNSCHVPYSVVHRLRFRPDTARHDRH